MSRPRLRLFPALVFAAFLAGCNSPDQALAPVPGDVPQLTAGAAASPTVFNDAGAAAAQGPVSASTAQVPGQSASLPPAAPGAAGSLRFTPVIGAPVGAVTPLSRQLAAEARSRGFTIVSAAGQEGRHVLKGYFSAFNDGAKTTIVFVWDVLDPSGARLHRIQGQEEVPGAAGADPWAGVPPATMERIAARTFQDYQAWLGGSQG